MMGLWARRLRHGQGQLRRHLHGGLHGAAAYWRLGATHLATSLYVGAGGGLSSSELRFGGGLMLRPEISLRTEQGPGTRASARSDQLPGGNVDNGRGLQSGAVNGPFGSQPLDAGRRGASRLAPGWHRRDRLHGHHVFARAGPLRREALPLARHVGFAGADLRQYIADGSWWGGGNRRRQGRRGRL